MQTSIDRYDKREILDIDIKNNNNESFFSLHDISGRFILQLFTLAKKKKIRNAVLHVTLHFINEL